MEDYRAAAKALEDVERRLLQPLAELLMRRVRERDPDATFAFGPGPDKGIWTLDARVAPPLDADFDFLEELTQHEVDFQIEHEGITVAPILLARQEATGSDDAAANQEGGTSNRLAQSWSW
jgi:hypothetical protein